MESGEIEEKEAVKGRNIIISVLYSYLVLRYLIYNLGQLLFLVLFTITTLLTLSDKAF